MYIVVRDFVRITEYLFILRVIIKHLASHATDRFRPIFVHCRISKDITVIFSSFCRTCSRIVIHVSLKMLFFLARSLFVCSATCFVQNVGQTYKSRHSLVETPTNFLNQGAYKNFVRFRCAYLLFYFRQTLQVALPSISSRIRP